jgi:hypothetical protein
MPRTLLSMSSVFTFIHKSPTEEKKMIAYFIFESVAIIHQPGASSGVEKDGNVGERSSGL